MSNSSSSPSSAPVSYAQDQEDLRLVSFFENTVNGVFLEIGAYHPTDLSMTCLLEERGWTGVLIEPNPEKRELFESRRPGSKLYSVAVSSPSQTGHGDWVLGGIDDRYVGLLTTDPEIAKTHKTLRVPIRTVDEVLEEAGVKKVDFVSLDVDGIETDVLDGFSLARYQPQLISIEDHVHDLHKHQYLTRRGYRLIDRCGCNGWYVPGNSTIPWKPKTSRWELFRKYYLALPFRMIRVKFKHK